MSRPSPHPRSRFASSPPSVRLETDLAPLRRRGEAADPDTAESPTGAGGTAPAADGTAPAADGTDGRLAEILAENGVDPSAGSRRRRRYREEGESDDVLARVLGLS